MDLGYFVQSVDPRIASGQSFLEMCPGTHVLVTGPVKFYTRLAKKFWNIDSSTALPFSCSTFYGLTFSSPRPHHIPIAFSVFCLLPNPPNRVKVLVVLLLSRLVSFRVSRTRLRSSLAFASLSALFRTLSNSSSRGVFSLEMTGVWVGVFFFLGLPPDSFSSSNIALNPVAFSFLYQKGQVPLSRVL